LSLQVNGTNFIDKKQSERKQILSQFMDIDIFDQLYEIAKEDSNEERFLLKSFQRKDSYAELAIAEQSFKDYKEKEQRLSGNIHKLEEKISGLENVKLDLIKKIWKSAGADYNLVDLEKLLEKNEKKKDNLEKQYQNDLEYKETLRPLYLKYHKTLRRIDEDKIKINYDQFQDFTYQLSEISGQIRVNKSEIRSNEAALKDLKKYKYDPNCSYCLDNAGEHINHQEHTQQSMNTLTKNYNGLVKSKEDISNQLEQIEDAVKIKEEYDRLTEELNQISQDAVKIGGRLSVTEEQIKFLDRETEELEEKIKNYYENEQKIQQNQKFNEKIDQCSLEITSFKAQLRDLSSKYKIALSNVAINRTEKKRIERDIEKLIKIEQKILDYDLYLMAISKNGIPYELIAKTIPSIEAEINEVLDNMMVGFTIKLDMEGKNVNTSICYGDQSWPLDLASGMERFVSSLAIRVGLINVSTLPRPNFLCLDEGFGSLDGDNIANMQSAFDYLKTQFDFVLIITHLDSIKDYTDHLIPIQVKKGYSQIIFV
jgi:DNA repair exonuclease SbcCD ATPase subunit